MGILLLIATEVVLLEKIRLKSGLYPYRRLKPTAGKNLISNLI